MPALGRSIQQRTGALVGEWYASQFAPELLRKFECDVGESVDRAKIESRFLTPLLKLLAEFAITGEAAYRDLYLGERRRYAPHRLGAVTLRNFFQQVIPSDTRALVAGLPADEHAAATAWLEALHAPLLQAPTQSLTMVMVGDCLLTEVQAFLNSRCTGAGFGLDPRFYYFSARTGVGLDTDAVLGLVTRTRVDLFALSFLSYEGLPLYRALLRESPSMSTADVTSRVDALAGLMRDYLMTLRSATDAPILLHNASGLPISRVRSLPFVPPLSGPVRRVLALLNQRIDGLVADVPNCFLIDERQVVATHGIKRCARPLLPRRIVQGAHFHPSAFGPRLAAEYFSVVDAYRQLRGVKVLLIDFDNTLWRGVMADGPVTHHRERQQLLVALKERGMLLVAVSKNTPENVRWDEMAIGPGDFVSMKISWNQKARSIEEVADELNLGTDSFLLVDDNPAERELVRATVPGVRCVDGDAAETWQMLAMLFRLPNTQDTEEAKGRTRLYQEQRARQQSLASNLDYAKMMSSLELKARCWTLRAQDLDRASELVQRTNQFNTTTIRYSRRELESFIGERQRRVVVGELQDKFGNLGIVAVVVLTSTPDSVAIDNFVMSCRAMGFGMEQLVLADVLAGTERKTVVGRFIPTPRNEPASTLYRDAGFDEVAPGEWQLAPGRPRPSAPVWFEMAATT